MKRCGARVKVVALVLGTILSSFCAVYSALAIVPRGPEVNEASALFSKECATCHGKDGQAKTFKAKFNHARNLTDAKWQTEVTDERLFNSVHNGKGKMPAFGKKLSDSQINALVAFVRTLKG